MRRQDTDRTLLTSEDPDRFTDDDLTDTTSVHENPFAPGLPSFSVLEENGSVSRQETIADVGPTPRAVAYFSDSMQRLGQSSSPHTGIPPWNPKMFSAKVTVSVGALGTPRPSCFGPDTRRLFPSQTTERMAEGSPRGLYRSPTAIDGQSKCSRTLTLPLSSRPSVSRGLFHDQETTKTTCSSVASESCSSRQCLKSQIHHHKLLDTCSSVNPVAKAMIPLHGTQAVHPQVLLCKADATPTTVTPATLPMTPLYCPTAPCTTPMTTEFLNTSSNATLDAKCPPAPIIHHVGHRRGTGQLKPALCFPHFNPRTDALRLTSTPPTHDHPLYTHRSTESSIKLNGGISFGIDETPKKIVRLNYPRHPSPHLLPSPSLPHTPQSSRPHKTPSCYHSQCVYHRLIITSPRGTSYTTPEPLPLSTSRPSSPSPDQCEPPAYDSPVGKHPLKSTPIMYFPAEDTSQPPVSMSRTPLYPLTYYVHYPVLPSLLCGPQNYACHMRNPRRKVKNFNANKQRKSHTKLCWCIPC